MPPVTFSPKFRPDTISQFLEESKQLARLDAMMNPTPPAPLWADPMQRGVVSREEWMNYQDPESGQHRNWQAYASDFLGKGGMDQGGFRIGQTAQDGIVGPDGRKHQLGGEAGSRPFKPAPRPQASVVTGYGLNGIGKRPTSRGGQRGSGAGAGKRSYRRGAYAGFGSFTGGR